MTTQEWIKALSDEISRKIKSLKRDGIVSMGRDNLLQVVRPPAGGPGGTNAQYMYRNHWFTEALSMLPRSQQAFVS